MKAHSVWAEIDLRAIAHNLGEVRRLVAPQTEIMAVVKADGYGHGALQVARTALDQGASRLAVARGEEAVSLREAGIEAPILVFGALSGAELKHLIDYDLTFTIFSRSMAEILSRVALQVGRTLPVHLKIDTGMGRLGFQLDLVNPATPPEKRLRREVLAVAALPGLELEGIYTHFASADASDKTFAHRQLQLFVDLLESLRRDGLSFPLRHAANSAAILDLPEAHFDLVRAGIMLYGLSPSGGPTRTGVNLRPAMQFKTRVSQIKDVPAGFPVSYGSSYRTSQSTRLATVSVGYADGLSRLLSSNSNMLVKGVRVPLVGRVCMDQSVLDVGAVAGVRCGDEVVVFGRQGTAELSVGELAALLETINYEVVSTLTARVPRLYHH